MTITSSELKILDSEGEEGHHFTWGAVLQPWEENPRNPITWWDMLVFSAKIFYVAASMLEYLIGGCRARISVELDYMPLEPKDSKDAIKILELVADKWAKIGMPISSDTAMDLKNDIASGKKFNYTKLGHAINNLNNLAKKEISGKLFFYMPPEKIRFWPKNNIPSFGDKVATAFPSAIYDIFEASISLSLSRGTACVFHLMRALEIALTALGTKFGVSLAHTNWAPAIEEIERKIRDMHKDPVWKTIADCKEQQEFFAQAASHFGILKDAWRNYTMHSRGKCTEEEAERIYENVKSFMQKLAEGGIAE